MGIVGRAARIDAHHRQRSGSALARLRSTASIMREDRLGDLSTDAQHGVERIERALRDHRDAGPADAAALLGVGADQILAQEADRA